jgi:hypothetical protein
LVSLNHSILKWESGAKVRQIFETTKFFGNFFQKIFIEEPLLISSFLSDESGCKDKSYF